MKLYSMSIDENGRSRSDYCDIPLHKVSDTEYISEKQVGTVWRIGFRTTREHSRTSPEFHSESGPYALSTGSVLPHLTGIMSGHLESTTQEGGCFRLAAGDFHYVGPGAMHHSNNFSLVPVIVFHLGLPGTLADTQNYVFK